MTAAFAIAVGVESLRVVLRVKRLLVQSSDDGLARAALRLTWFCFVEQKPVRVQLCDGGRF